MITSNSVRIPVPADVVWSVFADVERWPTWTTSVTSIQPLDGAEIDVGRRFRIKQPRLPVLVWRVNDVEPGRSWTWTAGSAGARTYAAHEVQPDGDNAAVVTQRIDQRGPLGALFGMMTRRMTRRYLAVEADGLKAASEEQWHGAPQSQ
ncbi:MAG TPA: SRPBCC family protein [Jatrophihabitantaceae bacterium]|jgi:uncharacterized membrane protein